MDKLLIVDDEETIRFVISVYFSSLGCDVDCAGSLAEAKSLLDNHTYAIVITDIRLSEDQAEGLEIIELVQERRPLTPVLLRSAYSSDQVKREVENSLAMALTNKSGSLANLARTAFRMIEAVGGLDDTL